MLSIKSVLMPFRMSLSKREPITFRLELSNTDDDTKLLTLKLMVDKDLSIEKTTIANILEKKIGEIKPNETKLMYFDIYPKVSTRKQEYNASLVVYEHYNGNYELIAREYKKDFSVKVVD